MKPRFRIDPRFGQHLMERGVALSEVLRRARLVPGFFDRDKVEATTDEFFAMWAAIGAVSGDPAIGLLLGSEDRLEHYTPISVTMLYTRSFAEALDRAARYKKLSCPEEIEITVRDGEHTARFHWLLAEREAPEPLVDLCFAWLVNIGRRGTGTALSPARLELRRPAARARMYERHFGCPVVFGAEHDAIVFRSSDVERPFLTHNAEFLAILAPHLEAELSSQREQQDVLEQVKAAIKRLLVGQRPDLEDVARDLCVSPRTLQRRLAGQGRSYQQLLEEARRELSHRYLLDTKLELNETAFLLGYTDASSFFRAFRQWEGTSPGQWRKSQSDGTTVR